MSAAPILAASAVRKTFGGLVAVDDLTFTIEAGETVGLIGPNGSGKTTMLNMISGAARCDTGDIMFKGTPIARLAANRIARLGVGRTFQLVRVLGELTCAENIVAALTFGRTKLWGRAAQVRAEELLARVGLAGKAALHAEQLTYIDQKRLELARALALAPDLLLLDEWLAGLNPSELQEGIALIRSLRHDGLTIVMVEHVMDAIRSLCGRCIVMNAGRKIADRPATAVLSDPTVIHAYLGEADA